MLPGIVFRAFWRQVQLKERLSQHMEGTRAASAAARRTEAQMGREVTSWVGQGDLQSACSLGLFRTEEMFTGS